MNMRNADTLNSESVLENLTHTLLYEGYALYPYHRSSVKNQKPVPFGVVFPQNYSMYNVHAHSEMQTQCIVTGTDDLLINITVRFLHLKKIELLKKADLHEPAKDDFIQVDNLHVKGKSYQSGWQTIERTVSTGHLQILQLIKNRKVIPIEFDKMYDSNCIHDEGGEAAAKQISSVSEIKGTVIIEVALIENKQNAFRITVGVVNTTPVEITEVTTRDEMLSQSFLSTHIILQTMKGKFISHQNPEENWKVAIEDCRNLNTWPILIDENDTTLLSSPIILYDYPQINPQSSGDLFDSTEIEEALLLHVGVLSDDEKKRIAQSDEKLQAMLNKMSQITPEELISFHSGLKYPEQNQINHQQKAEE